MLNNTSLLIFLLLFFYSFRISSQNQLDEFEYCHYPKAFSLVGEKVKVYSHMGVIENNIVQGSLEWPSNNVKRKVINEPWSEEFVKDGDTGVVHSVLEYKKQTNNDKDIVYLLQIKEHFVLVGCNEIISLDQLDANSLYKLKRAEDSIKNSKYAGGCYFKNYYMPRTNIVPAFSKLDSIAESFACNLYLEKGIDTIILYRSTLVISSGFYSVSWMDKGIGQIAFLNSGIKDESEIDTVSADLEHLITYYDKNLVYDENSYLIPEKGVKFTARIQIGNEFYFEKAKSDQVLNEPLGVKSIWWNMFLDINTTAPNKK